MTYQMIIFLSVVDIFVLVVALLTYYKMKIEIEDLDNRIAKVNKRIDIEKAFDCGDIALRQRVDIAHEMISSLSQKHCSLERAVKSIEDRLRSSESKTLTKPMKVRSVKKS